jgi:hypothetical protein
MINESGQDMSRLVAKRVVVAAPRIQVECMRDDTSADG